tara:strand:- start:14821 stop:15735 length:915 start_codon:yes stop_codon:yes gene_type:complete
MEYPLVSIIINCFNGEKYLKNCLESILLQTYQKYEVIFWDNCSTDNSKNIFMGINDKRFKYFNDKNHVNLYKARNKALSQVSGNYISFLDVDDIWLPDKLSKQIEIFRDNKTIGFCYGGFKILNTKLGTLKSAYQNKRLKSGYLTDQLIRKYNIGILTLMVSKSIIEKYGIRFDDRFTIMGDLDFVLRISKNSKGIALKQDLGIYRKHLKNLSYDLDLTIKERVIWQKEVIDKSLFNENQILPFKRETKYLELINSLETFSLRKAIFLLRELKGIFFIKGLILILKKLVLKLISYLSLFLKNFV